MERPWEDSDPVLEPIRWVTLNAFLKPLSLSFLTQKMSHMILNKS